MTSSERMKILSGSFPSRIRLSRLAGAALAGLMLLAVACNLRTTTPPAETVSPVTGAVETPTPSGLTPQSPEETAYVEAVRRQSEAVLASIARFNEQMRIARPQNEDWKRQTNAQIDLWATFAPQARALTPPPRYQRFHVAYREALEHMAVASSLMREVQNTGNQALVPEVNSRINEANLAFSEAARRSDLVRAERITAVLGTSLVR
jgi:hypothetical protein